MATGRDGFTRKADDLHHVEDITWDNLSADVRCAMIKVCGLALYGFAAASTRYRLGQYVAGLKEGGVTLDIFPLLGDEYISSTYAGKKYRLSKLTGDYMKRCALLAEQKHYDLAIVHAELFPLLPGWIESRLLHIPYIYDFDDAFFLKYQASRFKYVSFMLKHKFAPVVARAAGTFAGNSYLADFAIKHNSATVLLPTVVDTTRYIHAPVRKKGVLTVGWIGSPSTSHYLKDLAEPLARIGSEGPVRLIVVGGRCDPIENVEVVNLPWSEAEEITLINSFDVGVMPLFDDAWARGKCAFKLIQYMACGVPVVASPVGANVYVVQPSYGFLANDVEEWVDALRAMRDNPLMRDEMGAAARAKVERQYSLRVNLPIMIEAIKTVAGRKYL